MSEEKKQSSRRHLVGLGTVTVLAMAAVGATVSACGVTSNPADGALSSQTSTYPTPTMPLTVSPGISPTGVPAATGGGPADPTDDPSASTEASPTVSPSPSGSVSPSATTTPDTSPAPDPSPAGTPTGPSGSDSRPNIVFISTDDQRTDDLRWMPYTRELLGGHGVTFTGALSPHPLCCPARAEFVTGQYGQNNGVHHNKGTHGGYPALLDPANTLAAWLHADGYQTAMVGKYLNGYSPDAPSKVGWDHWSPSVGGVYSYTHTTFYNDGNPVERHVNVDDAVTGYAADYIREFAQNDAPFYVWASDLAPHDRVVGHHDSLPIPATRFQGDFAGVTSPARRKPSYGRALRGGPAPKLTPKHLAAQQDKFQARIEALQSVDEGVRHIVNTLAETGELDHTYVVFTTDNGYLLGEHGLSGKNFIFDEALRVPMIVRVPGQDHATTSTVPVTAVDIAPTVVDLAGATPGRVLDGHSFAALLSGGTPQWRDTQLIQTGRESLTEADPGWLVRGVRTARWTYGLNMQDGSIQLYDRRNDPFEQVNLAKRRGYEPVIAELQRRALLLEDCAGESCRRNFGPDPLPEP